VQPGRLQDATDLLERAHRADLAQTRVTVSLGELYIRGNEPQKALDLTLAEKGESVNAVNILTLRAAAYLALGQRKDARSTYADILKLDSNSALARRQLVGLLIESGDYESARSIITAGIAASPRNYQLYRDYVTIDLKATGIDAALASADRLTAEDRDFAELRALRGDVYLMANRPADAVTAYVEAGKTNPSSLLTTRLAGALLRAGKQDEANTVLADWLVRHPDDMSAAEQAAEVNIASNQLPDAARYLEQVLTVKPHDAVALNNLAWVAQQRGDNARARVLAKQAYILSPGAQTADTLGWILTTSGDPGDGVALLRQASNESTSDPRINYHYAVALKDTGDTMAAKKQLEVVVAARGDFKEKAEAQKVLDELSKGS
jgi:putative PEP-CTERM system TPR-repeat lipoprotein